MKKERYVFKKAIPVWEAGTETAMNRWLSFRAVVGADARLALTGSSAYVVKVNGKFAAFGPARSAHGFYRVDELPLGGYCDQTWNVVTVTVAGYNANSFYHLDQPSFCCAEIWENGTVTAATGGDGFLCRVCDEHEEKALRYSFQRTFCETYNLSPALADWEKEPVIGDGFTLITPVRTEDKVFIARGCALNTYETIPAKELLSRETFAVGDHAADFLYPYWIRRPSYPAYKHFETADVTSDPALTARNLDITSSVPQNRTPGKETLAAGEALTLSFGREYTGVLSLSVSCDEDAEVFITFDEYLSEGNKINYRRMACNCLWWRLKPGKYELSTFEPYSLSVMRVFALKGRFTVSDVSLRFFGADEPACRYAGNDPSLQMIFDAAVQTYRQNTFTIFTDCPSRERAGWLCDSFFTARVEKVLTGGSEIEHNFLENFFLPDKFRDLPEGMFPMCYPGDHYDGNFIPNWAMFLVLELEEYLARTGDRTFVSEAKKKIYGLLDYFKAFENADGLLEKLEKWVFVEWSESNKLTQDINYPTNMLYARTLRAVAALYGDLSLAEKADRIARAVNEQSFTEAGFYCDNAVYGEDGQAHLSGKYTESCQYYAFFCGVATPETRPELWERLLHDFGPERVKEKDWPNLKEDAKWQEVYPANAFIGNYLRLELLWRYGEHEKLIENIKGYFTKMACQTGTLWENEMDSASCNHGFASHVLYWMDGLGLIRREKEKKASKLVLVPVSKEYKEEIMSYRRDFLANGETSLDGAGGLEKCETYEAYADRVRLFAEHPPVGYVRGSQYLGVVDGRVVGMLNLRHELNDWLRMCGGHIGYSVRPSDRGHGYAAEMTKLALDECRKLGIARVLITCDKKNHASAKTIMKCGGTLENEVSCDGETVQRYWVTL